MVQPVPAPPRVVLNVAQKSDPGLDPDKQVNEDACAYGELSLGHLLVVCDGMGGHLSGREASTRAVQTIFRDMEASQSAPASSLKTAIEHAGRMVYELGGSGPNPLRPGSTCVALLVHPGGTEIAHVGDSRAYLLRKGAIYPLTRDHSMVQQMVDAGVLTAQEAMVHPDANKITRALGMEPAVEVEMPASPMLHMQGDIFLLASDGLCDLVLPHEMLAVVMQARQVRGLEFACNQLVALANTRGGHDNITVLLAEVIETPAAAMVQPTLLATPPVPAPSLPTATLPEVPALANLPMGLGQDKAAPSALCSTGVHPTMVDQPPAKAGSEKTTAVLPPPPAPPTSTPHDGANVASRTWVDPEAAPRGQAAPSPMRPKPSPKRALWIVFGIAVLLFGLLVLIVSVWWAWKAVADQQPTSSVWDRERSGLAQDLAHPLGCPVHRG